jgi:hypothetical protein
VTTKVETVVSNDWRSSELIVELVLADYLVGSPGLKHGEGAVTGGKENPSVGSHRGTSVGLGVKALLVELFTSQGIQAKNGTVLLAKVKKPLIKKWSGDVSGTTVHAPELTCPTLFDTVLGFGEADHGNAPVLGRRNHQQALTYDRRGNETKCAIVLILRVESGNPPEFLPGDRVMTNAIVVAMSDQDVQITLTVSRGGCVRMLALSHSIALPFHFPYFLTRLRIDANDQLGGRMNKLQK